MMAASDLRVSLMRHGVCASARRAIMSGHHFVFEGETIGVIASVGGYLDEVRKTNSTEFLRIMEFVRFPFSVIVFELNGLAIRSDQYFDSAIFCIESKRNSIFGVFSAGEIATFIEDEPLDSISDDSLAGSLLVDLASAVLVLNRPSTYSLSDRPAFRRVVGGKLRPFSAAHVVHVRPGSEKTIARAIIGQSGIHLRRHERRGHWHRYGGDRDGCVHNWRLRSDDGSKFVCPACNRRLNWIDAYEAGDAGIGYVTKRYVAAVETIPPPPNSMLGRG